jgi:hypothetical protein
MKIALSGPGRCGKGTAAECLAKTTGLRYVGGTSWFARSIVFAAMPWWKRLWYWTPERAWRHRHKSRRFWALKIAEYNGDDPTRLYRDCLAEQDILEGVRWRHEQAACRAANLVDLWVWIDRPGIPPDPTMEYGPEACDLVIDNSGTLAEFHHNLRSFAARHGLLTTKVAA